MVVVILLELITDIRDFLYVKRRGNLRTEMEIGFTDCRNSIFCLLIGALSSGLYGIKLLPLGKAISVVPRELLVRIEHLQRILS